MASLIKAILVMQHRESPEIFGTKNLPEPGFSRTSKQLEPRHDGRLFSVVLNADAMDEHGYGISYSVLLERGVPVERTSRKTTQRPMTHAKEAGVPRLRAFLFPGQGSQYKEMLRPLADASEDCREILAGLDATLRRLDYPTFSEMAWGEIGGTEKGGGLGKDVFHTQLSLLVADTLFFELLRKFVGVPDLVLGHSYGEYPALVAANAWDFETAAIATRARCDAIDMLSTGRTGMLSTNACFKKYFAPLPPGDFIFRIAIRRNKWSSPVTMTRCRSLTVFSNGKSDSRCACRFRPVFIRRWWMG